MPLLRENFPMLELALRVDLIANWMERREKDWAIQGRVIQLCSEWTKGLLRLEKGHCLRECDDTFR